MDAEFARNLDTQLKQSAEKGFGSAIIVEVHGKIMWMTGKPDIEHGEATKPTVCAPHRCLVILRCMTRGLAGLISVRFTVREFGAQG